MSGTISDNDGRVPMKAQQHFIPLDDSTFLCFQSQAVVTQKSYGVFTLKNSILLTLVIKYSLDI